MKTHKAKGAALATKTVETQGKGGIIQAAEPGAENWPAGQAVQLNAPATGANVPAPHSLQHHTQRHQSLAERPRNRMERRCFLSHLQAPVAGSTVQPAGQPSKQPET